MVALNSSLRFPPAEVRVEARPDGSTLLSSPQPLRAYPRAVGEWLAQWADAAPERVCLAERQANSWRRVTYAQALDAARRIGQALLDRGLSAATPVVVLSDNSVDHALLMFGALQVGIPFAPISPAYSLMTSDHAKLKHIFGLLRPGLVFAADPQRFAPALAAVGAQSVDVSELLATEPGPAVDAAFAAVSPETVAKVLFTSGSTGLPKGVINSHRMLCANQQQTAQTWSFFEDEPPVLIDWLPWNHTFGGNFCMNVVLRNGGTMYIDGGKPVPGLIETTVRNIKEVRPTAYFNVPRGFDLLLPFIESDAELRAALFERCRFAFYAGAALPQNLYERLARIAAAERNGDFALVSAWGSTETAPLVTSVYFPIDRAGVIGLPVPGCTLKLVPSAGKQEVRVKGPNIMPGYFNQPELTAQAFDEDGFYKIGDAVKWVDDARPTGGLSFDGRVAEDFKLRTGTWVHVGSLRVALITACNPLLQDAVITGHDRDEVGALLFLNPVTTRDLPANELRDALARALRELSAALGGGSSTRVARALVLAEPPKLDAGEITDKGYINQRAVLENRATEVARLYSNDGDVIRP